MKAQKAFLVITERFHFFRRSVPIRMSRICKGRADKLFDKLADIG